MYIMMPSFEGIKNRIDDTITGKITRLKISGVNSKGATT